MINLPAILVANGTAIILLLMLSISSRKNPRYGLFDEKLYYLMVTLTILQCFVESAAFFIDGRMVPGYHLLAVVLNSSLYINNILFAFAWTVYADYKLFESKERIKKIYPFVLIPALLVILGVIINLFTPVFFVITPENVYQRVAGYPIPFFLTYGYLMYGVILVYSYRNKVNKYLFLPALLFMFPIVLGSFLQFLFYGTSLTWIGVAVALVSLYINVQNESSYVDMLSGLFTRQYLNRYLLAEARKTSNQKMLVGIMLDIDRFKSINDTYGHLMGDKAISAVGSILRSCGNDDGFASRYAGDEFVILTFVNQEFEIMDILQKIKTKTDKFNHSNDQPFEIQFSYGYSVFQYGTDTVDTFFHAIDTAMYEDKNRKIEAHKIPERRKSSS